MSHIKTRCCVLWQLTPRIPVAAFLLQDRVGRSPGKYASSNGAVGRGPPASRTAVALRGRRQDGKRAAHGGQPPAWRRASSPVSRGGLITPRPPPVPPAGNAVSAHDQAGIARPASAFQHPENPAAAAGACESHRGAGTEKMQSARYRLPIRLYNRCVHPGAPLFTGPGESS